MLKIQKKKFIVKNFLPFSLSIILISVIAIKSLYNLESEHLAQKSKNTRNALLQIYASQSVNYQQNFKGLVDILAHDEEVIKLYKNSNRKGLYKYTKSVFESLKSNFNISHAYFILPDKKVFLRIHNPNKYEDVIERYTLEQSIQTQTVYSGLELGLFNNLTLRVVVPWIIDGELLGYIELGEDIDHMSERLLQYLPVSHVAITMDKTLAGFSKYFKWFEFLKTKKNFDDSKKMVIVDSSFMNISASIKELLIANHTITNQSISIDALRYLANSVDLRDAKGQVIGSIVMFSDIKDEEFQFKRLLHESIFIIFLISLLVMVFYYLYVVKIIGVSIKDDLTGLYNKGYYKSHSKYQLQRALKKDCYLTLLVMDIDNFKRYNDTYGHMKGDDVLKQMGALFLDFFNRKNQVIYRVGGEEFAAILTTKSKEESMMITDKLLNKVLSQKIVHENNEAFGFVTISIGGITTKVTKQTSLDTLYAKADAGLYKAKEQGRNQVVFVDER